MDIIYDELCRNGIDIDIQTLSFHVDKVYDGRADLYHQFLVQLCVDDILTVWEMMRPRSFGHVISFLAMVRAADIDEDCRRSAVRNVVPVLRDIDIAPYKEYARLRRIGRWGRLRNIAFSGIWNFWSTMSALLGIKAVTVCGTCIICAFALWM